MPPNVRIGVLMGAVAPLAAVAAGASAGSSLFRAAGESRAARFKAEEAARAARAGRIAAAETDTQMREELRSVIGNIRAIRASAGIVSDSPTTAAVIGEEERVADRERRIRVSNIMAQAESDERASRFFRRSAKDAWLFGGLDALSRGASFLAR